MSEPRATWPYLRFNNLDAGARLRRSPSTWLENLGFLLERGRSQIGRCQVGFHFSESKEELREASRVKISCWGGGGTLHEHWGEYTDYWIMGAQLDIIILKHPVAGMLLHALVDNHLSTMTRRISGPSGSAIPWHGGMYMLVSGRHMIEGVTRMT